MTNDDMLSQNYQADQARIKALEAELAEALSGDYPSISMPPLRSYTITATITSIQRGKPLPSSADEMEANALPDPRITQLEARLAAAEAVIVAARAVAREATRCIGEPLTRSTCQDVPNECIGALNTALATFDRHTTKRYT
jgi:hypothetical protein